MDIVSFYTKVEVKKKWETIGPEYFMLMID